MIGRLETHLDTKLFLRGPTGVELTEDGRQLYHAVTGGFQRVEIALEDIRAKRGDEGTVTLSLSSAFATHWFMPRLGRFRPDLIDGDRACSSRSEEHTSELQSLMRTSYAVFCLKKKSNTEITM